MTNETSPLAPEQSPLAEADPNSLNEFIQNRVNEVFNKKPILYSEQDINDVVEYYQKERLRFKIESQQKELRPKAARGTSKKPPTSVADALAAVSTSADDLL
jgi:hypothetical protein